MIDSSAQNTLPDSHRPVTRRALKRRLAKTYDVRGLGALLEELIEEGWVEETDAGLELVDRI